MKPILPDIKVIPEDKREICGTCSGSGEGRGPDSICPVCKGMGELFIQNDNDI